MRLIKFFLLFLVMAIYLLLGALTRLFLFWAKPNTAIKTVNFLTYCLMLAFKFIGRLHVKVLGKKDILKEPGLFIISTHIGYIDGIIMGTLTPGSFTTKSEVRKIPFLGKVVSMGGSIFIDRQRKNQIREYIDIMTDRLKDGITIFNFPEGHASDGSKILPFYSAFFGAPLRAKAPIVPITIHYVKANGHPIKKEVHCYGNCSILKHLWKMLQFKSIEAVVTVHDKIPTHDYSPDSKGRKLISDLCFQLLSKYKKEPLPL